MQKVNLSRRKKRKKKFFAEACSTKNPMSETSIVRFKDTISERAPPIKENQIKRNVATAIDVHQRLSGKSSEDVCVCVRVCIAFYKNPIWELSRCATTVSTTQAGWYMALSKEVIYCADADAIMLPVRLWRALAPGLGRTWSVDTSSSRSSNCMNS